MEGYILRATGKPVPQETCTCLNFHPHSTWQCLSIISFTFANWFHVIKKKLFIYGCAGSSLLRTGFPQLWQLGTTLECHGFSCCRAQAQQPWHAGLAAACGVFLDQALTSCTGRRILYHWATREVLVLSDVEYLFMFLLANSSPFYIFVVCFSIVLSIFFLLIYLIDLKNSLCPIE